MVNLDRVDTWLRLRREVENITRTRNALRGSATPIDVDTLQQRRAAAEQQLAAMGAGKSKGGGKGNDGSGGFSSLSASAPPAVATGTDPDLEY